MVAGQPSTFASFDSCTSLNWLHTAQVAAFGCSDCSSYVIQLLTQTARVPTSSLARWTAFSSKNGLEDFARCGRARRTGRTRRTDD